MNSSSPKRSDLLGILYRQVRKTGPLGLIVLLHLAFFYALQSGLMHQIGKALPKEIVAILITPERAPVPVQLKPTPVTPKAVQIVRKSIAPLPAPIPITEAPTAISAPPVPAPVEPLVVLATPAPAPPAPPVPQALPAASGPPAPKQISSGLEYITPPRTTYPTVARRLGEEGIVEFRVVVNAAGKAEQVDIIHSSGSARLDEEARRAVMRAVFKPYVEEGKAMRVSAIGSIKFTLER